MQLFAPSYLADFTFGFLSPVRGLRIVAKNPKLLRYCIFPFLITFVAVVLWMVACGFLAKTGVAWLGGLFESDILQWIAYILGGLVAVVLMIGLALLFIFVFVQVIAAPFNSMLSQATESILVCTVPALEPNLWRETFGAIRIGVMMLMRALAATVILLPINLIPIVGTLAYVPLAMFFNCQALGLEFMDYCLERHHASLSERVAWARAHRPAVLGLGACVSLLLLLPVINLFFLPLCVVGGTELFVRLSEKDAA
jgi:CysZ protein